MDRRGLPGNLQRPQPEPDRMAGKGRWIAAAGGRGSRTGIKRLRAQRELAVELAARRSMPRMRFGALPISFAGFLKVLLIAAVLAASLPVIAAEKIIAARVWPA